MRSIVVVELFALVAVLVLTCPHAYGESAGHIGIVKSLAGEVVIVRSDRVLRAEPNFRLMEGDTIQTGPNGKAGLILEDDTVISLGFNSSVVINSFLFQPNEKKLSLIARVIRGTVSYVSGQIAKLAPNQVRIETPHATVGIRGTHVLVKAE